MADIESAQKALEISSGIKDSLNSEGATAAEAKGQMTDMKDVLETARYHAEAIETYFSELAAMLSGHQLPSYDEAVANEMAEEIKGEIEKTHALVDEIEGKLEGLMGAYTDIDSKLETLGTQIANVMTR